MGWAQTLILAQHLTNAIKAHVESDPFEHTPPNQESTMSDDVTTAPASDSASPSPEAASIPADTAPPPTADAPPPATEPTTPTEGGNANQLLGQVAALVDTLSKNRDIFLFLSALLKVESNTQNR